MFESYLEYLETALENCSNFPKQAVAAGQDCNLLTSGWIKFGCGNAVARLAEATRNELGAWAELQRAVHLERKMKSFVESLSQTTDYETFGDLLSRLSVVVELARKDMGKNREPEEL